MAASGLSEPRLGGRADDFAAATPQAAGWDLHERQQVATGECQRRRIVIREAFRQRLSKLLGVARLLGEHGAGVVHHHVEIDVVEAAFVARVGVQLLGEDRLGEGSQHETVVGGDEVDGAPLHRQADDLAIEQERLEFGGPEVAEP